MPKVGYSNVTGVLNKIYDILELGNFENYKDHVPFLRWIAEQNNLENIKISNVLDHGNLINKICKITIDEDIEYVIMATKGVTSLTETFFRNRNYKSDE